MNPSLIKKIINKKVTSVVSIGLLPVKIRHSPICGDLSRTGHLFLTKNTKGKILKPYKMRHRIHHYPRRMEHHPGVGIGLFFILLGVSLLIATNDLFHLGSVYDYFTWQTAMIFVGALLILNLHFTGGLLLIAGGIWFLQDEIFTVTPDIFRTLYWPAVIVILGLSFIVSSLFKGKKQDN